MTGTGGRCPADLVSVIEAAGYRADLAAGGFTGTAGGESARLAGVVCLPLTIATIVLSMVPAAQFGGWQWISLAP